MYKLTIVFLMTTIFLLHRKGYRIKMKWKKGERLPNFMFDKPTNEKRTNADKKRDDYIQLIVFIIAIITIIIL